MSKVFTSEQNVRGTMFSDGITYVIPDYQRPYSWQSLDKSDKNNQVNQLWRDLWDFFQENQDDREYFLGSMVIFEKARRVYEVVDGQQRLTTLVLLFAAMKCFLKKHQAMKSAIPPAFFANALQTIDAQLYNREGFSLSPDLKVKIQRSVGYDYDSVLKGVTQCDAPISSNLSSSFDKKFYEIVKRYYDNRDFFIQMLESEFLIGSVFGLAEADRFAKFFRFIQQQVSVVLIRTERFEMAYYVFEILNNRGLPLSNKDLLRNFFIREYRQQKVSGSDNDSEGAAAALWEQLEQDFPLEEEFIPRWVECITGEQQRYSAFNDLTRLYASHSLFKPERPEQTRIQKFYELLKEYLSYYAMIREPDRISDPRICIRIRTLDLLGNVRYTRDFLLALFGSYRYDGAIHDDLYQMLRRYITWILSLHLDAGRRFNYGLIYKAITDLNHKNPAAAYARFELNNNEIQICRSGMDRAIEDFDLAKSLLCFYVWCDESKKNDVVTLTLDPSQTTLEHILPQKPASGSEWFTNFSSEERQTWINCLGNMTLLTSKMNSSLKNSDFLRKKGRSDREGYRATILPLTRDLLQLKQFTVDELKERHDKIRNAILGELELD